MSYKWTKQQWVRMSLLTSWTSLCCPVQTYRTLCFAKIEFLSKFLGPPITLVHSSCWVNVIIVYILYYESQCVDESSQTCGQQVSPCLQRCYMHHYTHSTQSTNRDGSCTVVHRLITGESWSHNTCTKYQLKSLFQYLFQGKQLTLLASSLSFTDAEYTRPRFFYWHKCMTSLFVRNALATDQLKKICLLTLSCRS